MSFVLLDKLSVARLLSAVGCNGKLRLDIDVRVVGKLSMNSSWLRGTIGNGSFSAEY